MKKLLALVLALVMTLGLATVGANAATTYSDADSISYKEAVNVMSAVGVFDGDNGSFNPKGTLTREQGAKIITYMLLGKTAADALNVSSAPFADVEAGRWSAGSIAYCKTVGILGGVGDNKFDPSGALTGAAWAKMCLTALGYDAKREGLTGGDWTLNVARLVNRADLANSVTGFSYNTGISREEAAQVAFNTMKATMVEYTGALTADSNNNLTAMCTDVVNRAYSYVSNGVGAARPAANQPDGFNLGTAGTMQFCENYFPNLKLDNTDLDDYGVFIDKWYIGASRLDYTYTDAKSATTAQTEASKSVWTTDITDVTNGQLYTLFDGDTFGTAGTLNITIWENGVNATAANAADVLTVTKGDNVGKDLGKLYKGATVTAYDDDTPKDGTPDYLNVQYGYLAKVTKVTAASSTKARYITMDVYRGTTTAIGAAAVTNVEFETEDFAKDDYVMVYPKGTIRATAAWNTAAFNTADNIIEVKKVESVNGKVTAIGGTNSASVNALTIDGTKYNVAANENDRITSLTRVGYLATMGTAAATSVRGSSFTLNSGYTLYLSNGFVVGAKGDGANYAEYVYAIDDGTAGGLVGGRYFAYINQDGVMGTGRVVTVDNTTLAAALPSGWYSMSEDGSSGSGYYKLTTRTTTGYGAEELRNDGTTWTLSSKQPTITSIGDTTAAAHSIVANGDTTFLLRTGTTTFSVYKGIANVGNWSNTGSIKANVVMNAAGTYAALVYADMTTGTNASDNTTPVYLLEMSGTRRIDSKDYEVYSAIKDGELTEVIAVNGAGLLTGMPGGVATGALGALATLTYNSDGYVTAATPVITTFGTQATKYNAWGTTANSLRVNFSEPTLRISTNGADTTYEQAFTVASGAKVYYFNKTTDKLTVSESAADVIGDIVLAPGPTLTGASTSAGSIWLQFESNSNSTVKAIWVVSSELVGF